MKFLKENFGESEELNTFVYQLQRRFSTFYIVTLEIGKKVSEKFFAYKEAAQKYYNNLVKEANNDKFYYDGANITLTEVNCNPEYDDIEDITIYDEEDEEIQLQTEVEENSEEEE